jgi:predicted nucleotide-binding protein
MFEASSFPIENLERQLNEADFAVLVAGADDEVSSRGEKTLAPRDNVVFEAGLFMGALSRGRTFLLAPKGQKVKVPSDLFGMACLRFDPATTDLADSVSEAGRELVRIISAKGSR